MSELVLVHRVDLGGANVDAPDVFRRVEAPVLCAAGVVVSIGHDGTVRSWDIVTGEGRLLTDLLDYPGHSLAFSSDGELLAISDRAGTVKVLDSGTGEVVVDLEDVSGPSWLSFSPDGERLLGGGPGSFVHVWDLESGLISRRLRGSVYWPNDAVFMDGGRKVLVMSTEGVMRGYHLDAKALLNAAQDAVGREMTDEECIQYLGRACDAKAASER